jgi:hypothetical protein
MKDTSIQHTGMTSLPIPSAGMRPIFNEDLAVVESDLVAVRNILIRVEEPEADWVF